MEKVLNHTWQNPWQPEYLHPAFDEILQYAQQQTPRFPLSEAPDAIGKAFADYRKGFQECHRNIDSSAGARSKSHQTMGEYLKRLNSIGQKARRA